MYDVVKVVDLVRHFCASCQRHGLCDEESFPQNFFSIIKEREWCARGLSIYLSDPGLPHVSLFFVLGQRVCRSGPRPISMSGEDKIRTLQEGSGSQRHGQSDSEVRPTDDQDFRSVYGERTNIFLKSRTLG